MNKKHLQMLWRTTRSDGSKSGQRADVPPISRALKSILAISTSMGLFASASLAVFATLVVVASFADSFGGVLFWVVAAFLFLVQLSFLILGVLSIRKDIRDHASLNMQDVLVVTGLVCGFVLSVSWIIDNYAKGN